MTHDKIDHLIIKIIEKPEKLTDAEIAEITGDDYLRSLYDTASLLKTATEQSHGYDLEHEWQSMQAFMSGNHSTSHAPRKRKWLWTTAAFLCVLLCVAVGILFSRVSDLHDVDGQIAEMANDSINLQKIVDFQAYKVDTIAAAKIIADKETNRLVHASATNTDSPGKIAIAEPTETVQEPEFPNLPTIDQALYLTEEDLMIAQIFLASYYDTQVYDDASFVTTVNFGDCRPEIINQPTWLSEVMKYATGLTVDNPVIQRGSVNMLYRLTGNCADVSASDRMTALSIITALVDDGIGDNDPLTFALLIGSQKNLK